MLFCSFLSYLDRQTLAVLSPLVLRDTGVSVHAYADALSVFSISYMVSNLFWGSILDTIGLRLGMLLAVGIWTLACASQAWVTGFAGFATALGFLGFGEGATFPGGLYTATSSLPSGHRSRGTAIAYSGSAIGSVVAPLVLTPIALHWGWRAAFLATGVLGGLWLTGWWFISRPPWVAPIRHQTSTSDWANPFERRFWMIVALFGLGAAALGPVLYLSPLYLNRVMGFGQAKIGSLIWLPAMGWGVGYYFWGWFADRFLRNQRDPSLLIFLLACLAIPLAFVTRTSSPALALSLFTWAMFVAVAFIVVALHLGVRNYSPAKSGLVAGIGSAAWSAVIAFLLPVYGRWFEGQFYDRIFDSLALLPLIGAVVWFWIGRGLRRSELNPIRDPVMTPGKCSAAV
jgi:ACS family hexuronate transporter-like MFS transporter